jgi:hypothetical protein
MDTQNELTEKPNFITTVNVTATITVLKLHTVQLILHHINIHPYKMAIIQGDEQTGL